MTVQCKQNSNMISEPGFGRWGLRERTKSVVGCQHGALNGELWWLIIALLAHFRKRPYQLNDCFKYSNTLGKKDSDIIFPADARILSEKFGKIRILCVLHDGHTVFHLKI